MYRAVSSIYTSVLDAPPAACISVPFQDGPHDETDPQVLAASSASEGGDIAAGGSGRVRDQGDGGSAARARCLLVTGTYTLDKESGLRHGTLLLHEAAFGGKLGQVDVKLYETVPLLSGSVLDIRLLPSTRTSSFPGGSKFAVASSTGQIYIYAVSPGPTPHLELSSTHQIADEGTLLLSLAVSPIYNRLLAATTNRSTILLVNFTDNDFTTSRIVTEIENVHNTCEAWTSVFSTDGNTLYSGGDDSSFAAWDLTELTTQEERDPDEELTIPQAYKNRKAHNAGVTAILPTIISGKEYIFTGSYDQFIRVYSPSSSRWLDAEVDLEGGVWRLEQLPHSPLTENSSIEATETVWLLASCMHAGCCVVKAEFPAGGEEKVVITPVAMMKEHESMNYASACLWRTENHQRECLFVSTSFYDKRFCCWRL